VTTTDSAIFISYRAADSRGYAALLYLELSRCFGHESVFLDSESIPAGVDCVDLLLGGVRRARVVLAVVGPAWLAREPSGSGRRNIDNPADWIRRELSEAFAAGIKVIPVLVDDATLPAATQLSSDIRPLSRCQYRRLRHREAVTDLRRLTADLCTDPLLAAAARRRPRPHLRRLDRHPRYSFHSHYPW
jgi:hypothetical protein